MSSAEARVFVDVRAKHEVVASNTNASEACSTIESVDDVAELLLCNSKLIRNLIESERLLGVVPADDVGFLVERLLTVHGTQGTIERILDTPPSADVIQALGQFNWKGHVGTYSFVSPGDDEDSLRDGVVLLRRLVTAHLQQGPEAVDSLARSTSLLRVSNERELRQDRLACRAVDPSTFALLELIAGSDTGHLFVALGEEFLMMTATAFKVLTLNWDSWLQLLDDGDYVEEVVRLTPGLPPGAEGAIVAQLRRKATIRAVSERDAPALQDVALLLSNMKEEAVKGAAERIFETLFGMRFENLDEFLMACLSELVLERRSDERT